MPTIGVAIALPEPWAGLLQRYRQGLGDAAARLTPTHITLVPPTEVDSVEDVAEHLGRASVDHPAFTVHLLGTGSFRPVSPVVFVCLARGGTECDRLAAALRRGPLAVDLDFPYHPHVTVAHHLSDPDLDRAQRELADLDCEFDVREFHLYVHEVQSGWSPMRTYPLRTEPRGP